jgi:hypothetical protein
MLARFSYIAHVNALSGDISDRRDDLFIYPLAILIFILAVQVPYCAPYVLVRKWYLTILFFVFRVRGTKERCNIFSSTTVQQSYVTQLSPKTMKASVHINAHIPTDAWNYFKKISKYHCLFLPVIVHDFEFYESGLQGRFVHNKHGSLTPAHNLDVIFTHSEQKDPLTVGIIVWRNQEFSINSWNGPEGTTPVICDETKTHGYYLCSDIHGDHVATLLRALANTVTHIKVEVSETMIGEWTFSGYKELQSVDLGNVECVGCGAFYECEKLHKLIGGKALRILDDYCFSGCALEYVLLGFDIEFIGENAFWCHDDPVIKYVAFNRNTTQWVVIDDGVSDEVVYGGDWDRPDVSDFVTGDSKLLLRRELQYRPLRLDAILVLGLHYLYEDEGIIDWIDAMAQVFPSDAVYSREKIIEMVIVKHLK